MRACIHSCLLVKKSEGDSELDVYLMGFGAVDMLQLNHFSLQAQQLKFPLQQASQKLINSHYRYRVGWCTLCFVDGLSLQVQGRVVYSLFC